MTKYYTNIAEGIGTIFAWDILDLQELFEVKLNFGMRCNDYIKLNRFFPQAQCSYVPKLLHWPTVMPYKMLELKASVLSIDVILQIVQSL